MLNVGNRNDGSGPRNLASESPADPAWGSLRMKGTDLLDNAAIAELLAREGEQANGQVRQAFRRAARKAFLWEQETYDLLAAGKPLTELEGIGPFLADRIREWVEKTPPRISPPEIREQFLTLTCARRVLAEHPEAVRALNGDLHTQHLLERRYRYPGRNGNRGQRPRLSILSDHRSHQSLKDRPGSE